MPISDPTDVAGCVLWVAGDSITGLSDGDPVDTWEDFSGSTNDVTQPTGIKQPTYQTNEVNSKPIVRFDGNNDAMKTGNFSLPQPVTFFIVFRRASSPGANRGLLDAATNPFSRYVYVRSSDVFSMYAGSELTGSQAITPGEWYIAGGVFDGSSSYFEVHDENGLYDSNTGDPGSSNGDGVTVGSDMNETQPIDADIAIVIFYDSNIGTTDFDDVIDYLTDEIFGSATTDAEVDLSALTGQGVLVAPTIVVGNVIGLSPLSASGVITTQTVATGNRIDLSPLVGNGTIISPTVVVEGDSIIALSPVLGNGTIVQPTITHGNRVELLALNGSGIITIQSIEQGILISASPLVGNATLVDVSSTTGNRIDIAPISSRGIVVSPSLTWGNTISLSSLVGRGVMTNLTVDNGGEEPIPPILGARYTLDFRDLTGTLNNSTTLSATLNYR